MSQEPDPREVARRRGRRAGIAVFGVIVASVTAWWSLQIIRQVWAPEAPALTTSCRTALRDLLEAVSRARQAAAGEMGGEQASLRAFREALGPEWKARPAIDDACRDDARAMSMLEEIDELRYAEEHAVRYEAVRLARERKRALGIAEELGAAPESPK